MVPMRTGQKRRKQSDWQFTMEQIGCELGKIYRQPKRLPGQLRAVVIQLESNERLWNRAGQLAQPPIRYF
jgi:hypothetical protein